MKTRNRTKNFQALFDDVNPVSAQVQNSFKSIGFNTSRFKRESSTKHSIRKILNTRNLKLAESDSDVKVYSFHSCMP